jgi:dTDP-4-dehydrorhamnose reductase
MWCRVFNMGGPERLSRVDIAHKVAEAWGFDPKCIIPAPSASVQRNVASPPDISMDISRIQSVS